MKKVVLVHGLGGTHELHWQKWLEKELVKRKVQVYFPLLPKPIHPIKKEWVNAIVRLVKEFDKDTVLVGHSLGVPTILRILERLKPQEKVGGVFLVAGFCRSLGLDQVENFVDNPFNWNKIKLHAKSFTVIYSDSDPFISVDESLYLSEKLGAKTILEKNGGHITAPDFGPYKKILELIEKELN